MDKLILTVKVLPDAGIRTASGRIAWALLELLTAGARGCTTIDHPAPRWSAYIFKLRHENSLAIETLHERHGGLFAGNHARYILRSKVEVITRPNGLVPEDA